MLTILNIQFKSLKLILKATLFVFKLFFKAVKALFNSYRSYKQSQIPVFQRLNSIYKTQKTNPSKAGYDFEVLFRDHLRNTGLNAELAVDNKKAGKYPKEFLNRGNDGGIDVIASDKNKVIIIQTKFYSAGKKVDGADIGKTSNMALVYKNYMNEIGDNRKLVAMVVTNVDFDSTSAIHAKHANVVLMDGKELISYFEKTSKNAGELSNDAKNVINKELKGRQAHKVKLQTA